MTNISTSLILALAGAVSVTSVIVLYYFWRPDRGSFKRLIPAMVAFAAGVIPLTTLFLEQPQVAPQFIPSLGISTDERLSALENDLKKSRAFMTSLENQLALASSSPHGDTTTSPAALAAIDQRLAKNSESIQKFEQLLMTDASRLVTLPLMQKDFQSIKDDLISVKDNVTGLRTLVAENGTQNRWVIGTLAFGMLALVIPAVRSLLTPAKRDESKPAEAGSKRPG